MAFETPPGAQPHPPDLTQRLEEAAKVRAARGEPPRTRHLREGGEAVYANRLLLETSPYLLQHAHNPVDWRPWGTEAFDAAREANKPLFLSVGYSTCHWCHVMEEESFEDPEVAKTLNERFVCIKVDREERPDVDSVYMQAVQLLTQHGGWPMSVFMTPDGKPFFGGTYFPPRDGMRGARVGFTTVVKELARVYAEENDRALKSADEIARSVKASLAADLPTGEPGPEVLEKALQGFAASFDARFGGLRRAPKFPSSLNVPFLLRAWKRSGNQQALAMATLTLEKMAAGGLYDQVGGGFHRYSTDQEWLVPHFEKMLYDNALLAAAYLEGHLATRDEKLKFVACDILDYVARELADEGGAFWSATDADSEGEEGLFFVWTPEQVREVLGAEDGDRFCRLFDITEEGNFEGHSIPHLAALPSPEDRAFIDRVRPKLYAERKKRIPPLTDTKVLTAWNGLMISAFARAGLWLGRGDYVERARAAATFLLDKHVKDGKLLRTSMRGVARHTGLLDDHANLAAGLVDLFEATGEPRWLEEARGLHEVLRRDFRDEAAGGYFRTPRDHEVLLAREKPLQDGAEPCGNSVAALTLLKLEAITGDASFREEAEGILRASATVLEQYPQVLGQMLLALDWIHGDPLEIVLVRPDGTGDAALFAEVSSRFLPASVVVRTTETAAKGELAKATPLVRDRGPIDGKAVAYVCRKGACGLPATDAAALAAQLGP